MDTTLESARARKVLSRKLRKDDELRAFAAKEKAVKLQRDATRRGKEADNNLFSAEEEEQVLFYADVRARQEEKARERREYADADKKTAKNRAIDRSVKTLVAFEE